jgi:hypothetical protein
LGKPRNKIRHCDMMVDNNNFGGTRKSATSSVDYYSKTEKNGVGVVGGGGGVSCESTISGSMSVVEEELREVVRDLELDLGDALLSRKQALEEVGRLQGLLHDMSGESDELVNDMQCLMDDNDDLKKEMDEGMDREKQMSSELEKVKEETFLCQETMEAQRAKRLNPDEISEAVRNVKHTMERQLRHSKNERQEMERMVEKMSQELEMMRDQMLPLLTEKKTSQRRCKALQGVIKQCEPCSESFARLETEGGVPKDADRKGGSTRRVASLRKIIAPPGGGSRQGNNQNNGNNDGGEDHGEPASNRRRNSWSLSEGGGSGVKSRSLNSMVEFELPSVNEDESQRVLRLPDDDSSEDEEEPAEAGTNKTHNRRGGNLFGRNKRQGRHSTGCLTADGFSESKHFEEDVGSSVVSASQVVGRLRRPSFTMFNKQGQGKGGRRESDQGGGGSYESSDMMAALARAKEVAGTGIVEDGREPQSVLSDNQLLDLIEAGHQHQDASANSLTNLRRKIKKNRSQRGTGGGGGGGDSSSSRPQNK